MVYRGAACNTFPAQLEVCHQETDGGQSSSCPLTVFVNLSFSKQFNFYIS